MHIKLIAIGSQGDVRPYAALGAGLRSAGYDVSLVTNPNYETLARSQGLDFRPVEGNFRDIVESDAARQAMGSGQNFFASMQRYVRSTESIMQRLLADSWQACQDADAIVYSALSFFGYHIADKLGVPSVAAYLYPVSRTSAFASVGSPNLPLGGAYNRLTFAAAEQMFWQPFRPIINRWRQETLQLPPIPFLGIFNKLERQHYPSVYGYSPNVVPKPADWGDWLDVTGYWFLERSSDWQPPTDLVEFLRSGPPPVYVGFGSMNSRDARATTEIVLEALARSKQRGILLTGWGGLSDIRTSDQVFVVESAPHDWLFPQTAAVVHHGGAGTTGAGLRAGVPSVVVPFFVDQFFWGDRVAALGVGPRPIPHKQLSVERLAAAITTAVDDEGICARAAELGRKICAERGVELAVQAIIGRIGAF